MDWILRPALVATVGLGQILAPQALPAGSPDQIPDQISVEASVGPSSVYSSADLATALADGATTDSTMFVSGRGAITDISVRLRIAHPRLADLDIQLIAPDGTAVKLANNVGGTNADFGAGNANCSGILTTFDDDATTSVLAGAGPFLGVYRPDFRLSAFHGRGASGNWILRVSDESATQTGMLHCWQLVMRRTVISGDVFGNGRSDPAYWRPTAASVVARQIESGTTNTFTYIPGTPVTDILALAERQRRRGARSCVVYAVHRRVEGLRWSLPSHRVGRSG